MQATFVVRLIDLTLLLLLSLLAVVKINEYEVDLPISLDLTDQGGLPTTIRAAISSQGDLYVEGAGLVDAQRLAQISTTLQRPVELRVDANADALRLMNIHHVLENAGRPAVFIVEHRAVR